jgi:hypothetical protein
MLLEGLDRSYTKSASPIVRFDYNTHQYVKFQYQISIKNGKVLKKRDRRMKKKFGALRAGRSLCWSSAGFRGGESMYRWPVSTSSEDSLYDIWVSFRLLMRHPAVKARTITMIDC